MDQKENLVDRDLTLGVVLPGGVEKTATVNGSKPVMDLLVALCAKYHLNPSGYTIELITTNRDRVKFNPNALIGALEADKIILKPKGVDEKKKAGPRMPEATVRLVINFKKTQKTVLRVSPRAPLQEFMPAVCEKCEFDQKTTILLKDICSEEPLDLTKSLNDFGFREVYARDTKDVNSAHSLASPTHKEEKCPPSKDKTTKEKENRGLFGIFKRSTKKPDQAVATCTPASTPASPVLSEKTPGSMTSLNGNDTPSDVPKKRRAPLPPMMPSQSTPPDPDDPQNNSQPDPAQEESAISRGSLKQSKRRAPPPPSPPCTISPDGSAQDQDNKAVPFSDLEEIREQEEMVSKADLGGAVSLIQENEKSLNLSAGVPVDSGRMETTSSPMDVEMQVTSQTHPALEDHFLELSSDGKRAKDSESTRDYTDRTANGEQTHAPQLECRVSTDSDSSLMEEINGQPCLPGLKAETQGELKNRGGCYGESDKAEPHTPSTGDSSTSPDGDGSKRSTDALELEQPLTNSPPEVTTPSDEHQGLKKSSPTLMDMDTELKRKLSTESRREYIPKAGLTTYTIVPPKPVGKQRCFEVELYLQAPGVAVEEEEGTGSPEPDACLPETDGPHVPAGQQAGIREEDQLVNGAITVGNSDHGHMAPSQCASAPAVAPAEHREDCTPSSPSDGGVRAGPVQEVKEKKIPPTVKPKPDIFHLPQHKRTPVGYVDSAARKNASTASDCGDSELLGRSEEGEPLGEVEENSSPAPPPPPPPLPPLPAQREGEASERPQVEPECCGTNSPDEPPSTFNAKKPEAELDLMKLTSLTTPKPYVPAGPSRFSLAVLRRSQRLVPQSSLQAQPFGKLPSSTDLEQGTPEREDDRVLELRGVEHAGHVPDSRMPSQVSGPGEPGEDHVVYGGAELCSHGEIDSPAVPET